MWSTKHSNVVDIKCGSVCQSVSQSVDEQTELSLVSTALPTSTSTSQSCWFYRLNHDDAAQCTYNLRCAARWFSCLRKVNVHRKSLKPETDLSSLSEPTAVLQTSTATSTSALVYCSDNELKTWTCCLLPRCCCCCSCCFCFSNPILQSTATRKKPNQTEYNPIGIQFELYAIQEYANPSFV